VLKREDDDKPGTELNSIPGLSTHRHGAGNL